MTDNFQMNINIPLDEEGMLGRECPECKILFEIEGEVENESALQIRQDVRH